MSNNEKVVRKGGIGKFALGLGLGVAAGMLFAPEKGEETRKKLSKKINELIEYVQEVDYAEVKDSIVKKAREIEKEVKELDKEKALKIAKTKAKEIEEKANELVNAAVETAKPKVEKIAEDVRTNTVKTLKDITKKLEDSEKNTK